MLRHWLLCAAACCTLLLIGLLLFPSAGRDDTHITCWPARTLAGSGEMINYNGDRVEQSSSLLQVLVLAVLTLATGLDPLTLSKIVSVVFGVACIVAVFVLAGRAAGRSASFPAALMAALPVYFIYWSFGGLETTIVALAGLCVIVTVAGYMTGPSQASFLWPSAGMLMFLLARPEAPLLLGCTLACSLVIVRVKAALSARATVTRKAFTVRLLVLIALWATMSCALMLFRQWYFGSAFPQPVEAKYGGISADAVHNGITYVVKSLFGLDQAMGATAAVVMIAMALVVITEITAKEHNMYAVLAILYCAGYTAFAVMSGGDWMEGGRFLAFFLPVAMSFIPMALSRLTSRVWPLLLVTTLVAGLQVFTIIEFARYWSTGMPLWTAPAATSDLSGYSWFERRNRINLRDVPVITRLDGIVTRLAGTGGRRVVIMSGQMGAAAYHIAMKHYGRVRFMDRFGLTDRTFTTAAATRNLPRGRMGLQLWYEIYFAKLDELERADRLPRPDIIFDIGSVPDKLLREKGYTAIYRQSGRVVAGSDWFPGRDVIADEFIAVRTDLLPAIGNPKPVAVEYGR